MTAAIPPPFSPWTARALDFLQAAAVGLAILGGFVWYSIRADRLLDAVEEQIDRIENRQLEYGRYIMARDREWAEAIGLPWPPEGGGEAEAK